MNEERIDELEERLARLEKNLDYNTTMVRSLYRTMKFNRYFKIFYWLVLLSIAFGLLYFLQPYIEALQNTYKSIIEVQQQVGSFLIR